MQNGPVIPWLLSFCGTGLLQPSGTGEGFLHEVLGEIGPQETADWSQLMGKHHAQELNSYGLTV